MRNYSQKLRGFTLIELIVVIAIIVILAAIVLVAINPAAQIAQANNAQRSAAANAILNGLSQHTVANGGAVHINVTTVARSACDSTAAACAVGTADLGFLTLAGAYMPKLPIDPTGGTTCTAASTCYNVSKDVNNRITVAAPNAQAVRGTTPVISVTR